jgi:hypothetical protein
MACAAWGTAPAHAAIFITETDADSFRYATAPGWTIFGDQSAAANMSSPTSPYGNNVWKPQLTAISVDNPGSGWMRLTDMDYQIGMTVFNTPISREEGLEIIFDYTMYGSKIPDGIVFLLIDGDNSIIPTLGAFGGPAGYASELRVAAPGTTKGYVGIGLNGYGNFSSPLVGSCSAALPCKVEPQSVAVRGAGNGLDIGGFPLLKTVPLSGTALGQVSTSDHSDTRTVRISISPVTSTEPFPKVTVEIDPGSGFVKVIDALDLSNNGPVPATFKMGFSAATGANASHHEVRIRSARTLVSAVPALGHNTLGALAVLLALLTLPALRRQLKA